jgi:hypothetical protein
VWGLGRAIPPWRIEWQRRTHRRVVMSSSRRCARSAPSAPTRRQRRGASSTSPGQLTAPPARPTRGRRRCRSAGSTPSSKHQPGVPGGADPPRHGRSARSSSGTARLPGCWRSGDVANALEHSAIPFQWVQPTMSAMPSDAACTRSGALLEPRRTGDHRPPERSGQRLCASRSRSS